MSGESPTQFNNEPDAGSTGLIVGLAVQEIRMSKDFWVHLGAQMAVAAVTAAFLVMTKTDYSSLGAFGPMVQGAAAIVAELWNQTAPKV